MQPSCYRLRSETVGIRDRDGQPSMVTLPEGSVVTIKIAKVGSRMIDVVWEGAVISIFTQDLDDRGILEPIAGLPQNGHAKPRSDTA